MAVIPLDYLVVILPLLPFAVVGVFKMMSWIVEIVRVRQGYIKVIKKMPNNSRVFYR